MKNLKTFIVTGFMLTLGSISLLAFGLGADPDTYTPSPATTNFIKFTIANPLQGTIDTSTMYGKYYPELNPTIATIKRSSDNKMLYKFTQVVTGGINAPEGKVLIGSYVKSAPKAATGKPQHGGMAMINLYGIEDKEQN